jgi:hypothetical protein
MQPFSAANNTRTALFYAGFPIVITAVLWSTSINEISLVQMIAAFILCWIPWSAYQKWSCGSREGIPLFFLISAMYWVSYALPLFWLRHDVKLITGEHLLSEEAITGALFLAVLGVAALGIGISVGARWRFKKPFQPDIHRNPARWHYLRLALLVTTFLHIVVPLDTLGGGGRQFVFIIESIVPSVTFVVLLRYYLRGAAIPLDKALLFGYASVALVSAISSGWLGSFVGLAIMATIVYVYEKKKLPLVAIMVGIPIVLFLQPGKEKFRQQYWREGASENYIERFGFWLDSSSTEWGKALSSSDQGQSMNLANRTLGRLSLLGQTANIIEATPERVPYQYGRMYSYMIYSFIPRLFWEDKPSVNDANQWYQVAYRLTDPRNLRGVSIATGYLAESYMNFGWLGPPFVVFWVGVIVGLIEQIFLRSDSGLLLNSIGVVLLPHLLQVESQLAQYLAGFGQQIAVALITLAPMFDLNKHKERQRAQSFFRPGANYREESWVPPLNIGRRHN